MLKIKLGPISVRNIKLADLDPSIKEDINHFLKINNSLSNNIYMSPAWARRIYSIYGVNSEWTIYLKNSEIIGCHLIFDEYRGSLLFLRKPRFIKIAIHSLLRNLFSYNTWKVPLLLLENISFEDENKIISDFDKRITKLKNVKISPIANRHREEINGRKISWATYIFDFERKDYNDISSNYSRSLKRSLKDSFLNFDLEVQVLDFSNDVDVDNFCNWVISAQKLTGKSFIYDKKTLNLSNSIFQEDGYIYRIFILFDKGRGIILGGWASNSKYPFLGAIRSAAQMVSYEVSIGVIIINVLLCVGSLNLNDIVMAQENLWFVIPLFPMFVIFFISALAETNRPPFDLPEAEAELVAGYQTEYSGMMYAMFWLGEYANILLMCAMGSVLFLGGWLSPIDLFPFNVIPGAIWLILKINQIAPGIKVNG